VSNDVSNDVSNTHPPSFVGCPPAPGVLDLPLPTASGFPLNVRAPTAVGTSSTQDGFFAAAEEPTRA